MMVRKVEMPSGKTLIENFAAKLARRGALSAEAIAAVLSELTEPENEKVIDALCMELGTKIAQRKIFDMNYRLKKE
jgi:UDP-N-acetylglucosamine:LPS N-acetylglucosamine transferase